VGLTPTILSGRRIAHSPALDFLSVEIKLEKHELGKPKVIFRHEGKAFELKKLSDSSECFRNL